ncbi:MAG: M28 family peptidase, partial [Methanomicrobia archaeon]|nr:M28 family peptidase [Methanomicrobia archaeon]
VVLVTAHHDCWFEGANDNTASVCILFEIIKVFKKYKPLRTIKFVSFGAEESGAVDFSPWLWINGSRFFADSDLNIVGVLNNEGLGVADDLSVQGTGAEIRKVILDTADILKLKKKYEKIDTWHAFINSDHYPFTLKGIPTAQFSGKSALTQYKNYHTSTDTPEDIHEETLTDSACLAALSGFFLSHSLFLPYDPSVCFDELLKGNTELKARGLIQMNKNSVINLDKLIELLHRQKDLSDELCEIKNTLEKLYTGDNKEIEKYASKMNRKILEIIKKINLNSYHSVAYGEYELHIVPITIQMFPSLQALEDLYFTKKAIESLKDKNLSETLNNLRKIYPYESLSNGIEFYPPRFMPEYDLDLPFINPKEEIFSLENKKESNYEKEILSLTKKYETV